MLFKLDRSSDRLLLLLVSADIFFILLHIFHFYTPFFALPGYSLFRDRGFSEVYQYVKEYWIALLLLMFAIRSRKLCYLTWSALFGYLLIDDSSGLHERYGGKFAAYFDFHPAFGLRAKDFGELVVTGLASLFFFSFILASYVLSDEKEKRFSRYLAVILFGLGFFGVFMDMVDMMVNNPVLARILGTVEDGGEMLVMSIAVWFVFSHNTALKPAGE